MDSCVRKQWAWFLSTPLFIIIGIILVWNFWAKDQFTKYVSDYLSVKLPEIAEMQNFAELKVESIDFSILKLQASAKNIDFKFKNDLSYLNQVHVDTIKIQIDPFNLLIGQLSVSYIKIDSAHWFLDESGFKKIFAKSNQAPPEIQLEKLFKILPDIPLQTIYVTNTNLSLKIPIHENDSISQASMYIKSLQINNRKTSLELNTNLINFNLMTDQQKKIDFLINITSSVNKSQLKKLNLEIINQDSSVNLRLSSDKINTLLIKPEINSRLQATLNLADLKNILSVIKLTNNQIPQLTGTVQINSTVKTTSFQKNDGDLSLSYQNINVDDLKFGNGDFKSKIKNNAFDIDKIKLEHPSGTAELKNITLENAVPYKFKADIIIKQFSLQKLFVSLNLNDVPAFVDIQATGKCSGQISEFKSDCTASIHGSNISVDTDIKRSKNIVLIKKLDVNGDIAINKSEVNFKSTANLNQSELKASGQVNFKDGFNINFESNNLKLQDFENISGLKLRGITKGKLNTHGDSNHGVIEAFLDINQASIDDFYLGKINGNFDYKSGLLAFSKINGEINDSLYSGDIDINLLNETTRGDFKFKALRISDLLLMIEEKWHLPIRATGAGAASINFSGPLDFWKLKLNLNAQIEKGSLYEESFSKLLIQLNSDGNKINFDQFKMFKTTGSLELSNYIDTRKSPELNLTISSQGLKADDIDHLNLFYKNISGQVQINGKITGPLQNSQIITQSLLTNFQIDNYKLPNSQIDSELTKKLFHASGQIFGRQIQTDFTIPLSRDEKYIIKAKMTDFNPLLLLPFISLETPKYDIKSGLTGSIDISSVQNNLEQINGQVKIDHLFIERGQQNLRLIQPSELNFKNDLVSMTALNLTGPDQNLSLKLKKYNGLQQMHLSGRLFLKPFQFLVPFTENLTGIMEFVTYLNFKNSRPIFSGEGLINDASFSTKGFPYPLNISSAFFDLHESIIDFTEISGTLNQTPITGQGSAEIKNSKNIQVDVGLESEELELEFPTKIFTNGFAKVNFSGNWLPYVLKIDYDIANGLITKEFTQGTNESAISLPLNYLLPVSQTNKQSPALLIDAKIKLNKGLAIKNSVIEGFLTGNLNAAGPADALLLSGLINIQPRSRLIFKDKPFDIQNGFVKFNGTKEINPDINLSANARISDYDVNLSINAPAKNLDIKATSQPSLSTNDIFSLLALGYTSSSTDQNISSDIQQKQTGLEVLSAIGNNSELSKKIQSRLGLNVQLAPSIDSTRNIAVPKVIVSKKLSKKINTSYSRSLTGDRQNNEIKLQWLFKADTSLILNYQNQPSIQDNNIIQNQENDIGIGGFDIEYKKEFQ